MKIRTDFARKRRRENWKVTIAVGEGASFATWNSRHVYTSFNPNGTLSKNLHMTVWRFHVVLRLRTLIPFHIHATYAFVCVLYTARCSETKECSMSYEHESVQGLRKRAPLSLPEYISVTYSLSRMYEAIQIFKLLPRSTNFLCCSKLAATIHREWARRIVGNLERVKREGEERIDYASIEKNIYFFFLFIFPPPDSIRLPTNRREEEKKKADLIPGRWQ